MALEFYRKAIKILDYCLTTKCRNLALDGFIAPLQVTIVFYHLYFPLEATCYDFKIQEQPVVIAVMFKNTNDVILWVT